MKELIDVKPFKKNEIITLILKNRFTTFIDALNLRKEILGSKMIEFIKDYKIITRDDLQGDAFDALESGDALNGDSEGESGDKWWKSFYDDIPESKVFLRLYLDINFCYKHKIAIHVLAHQLETNPLMSANNDAVRVINSPMSEGIIDIYPTKNIKLPDKILKSAEYNVSETNVQKYYLLNIVYNNLKKLIVKGIENIKSMDIINKPILKTLITNADTNNKILYLNKKEILNTGISIKNLNYLVSKINKIYGPDFIELYSTDDEYIYQYDCKLKNIDFNNLITTIIKLSNIKELNDAWNSFFLLFEKKEFTKKDLNNENTLLILTFLSQDNETRISGDLNDKVTKYANEMLKNAKNISSKLKDSLSKIESSYESELQTKSDYIYIEAYIDNTIKDLKLSTKAFKETIKLQFVDMNNSYCNNVHIMASTLGIEAARNVYIRELYETIKASDSYINPSHYMYVADFITSLGFPLGTTSTSLNKQGIGHLSQASYEKAMSVLTKAAIFNIKEDIRGVSSSIIVGAPGKFGTKFFDIGTKVENQIYTNEAVYDNFENQYTVSDGAAEGGFTVNDVETAFEDVDDLTELFTFPKIDNLDMKYVDLDFFDFLSK
jgi:DNA-directed RNA polymerase beta' subunit